MRLMRTAVVLASILGTVAIVVACGSGGGTTQQDATGSGSGSGSGSATVTTVTCTGTPPIVSTDSDLAMHYTYSGSAAPTITVGSIVHFMLTPAHNAAPSLTIGDPGLKVPYGGDVCLKFSKAGTFGFYCTTHGFAGTVTVQ
jgi:plastocyanin